MPKKHVKDQKRSLRSKYRTSSKGDFNKMMRWFPHRLNIVSEGDSWFAYPPRMLFAGKPSNLIAHISKWTRGKANFYSMASNGDEAVDMVSGKQKHQLVDLLRWHESHDVKPVDLLLFSGGGNDVVGHNDFERFLRPYKSGYTARKCVNIDRLNRKAQQIGLAYEELAARTIADIYKARWQVELFFKWIKQNLKIQSFVGTSKNAVMIQIGISLCVYLLLAFIKFQSKLKKSMQKILRLLHLNLFEKRDLMTLLRGDPPHDETTAIDQMSLL